MKAHLKDSIHDLLERLPAELIGGTRKIAVAVSGGGDSLALLHLLAETCQSHALTLKVVTVDHGLRDESRVEAEWVGKASHQLGLPHKILSWTPIKTGNLQNLARRARYQMMADWAKSEAIRLVALGHTKNDQAETVMMNLARGSGIDGLSAMTETIERYDIVWIRPFLHHSRSELRGFLNQRGIKWIDDPSNDDDQFDRIKARRLIERTSAIGLGIDQLSATASRLQSSRVVLETAADKAANECASCGEFGEIIFTKKFWHLPIDLQLRISADALRAVSGNEYRPRRASLMAALDTIKTNKVTLSGCVIEPDLDGGFCILRELAACGAPVPTTRVWDGRWRLVKTDATEDLRIAALGQSSKRPAVLASTPALWKAQELWASPFIGLRAEWKFAFCRTNLWWNRFLIEAC